MDPQERLNLQKLVKEYGAEDTTKKIRTLKHSKLIETEISAFQYLKNKYSRLSKSNPKQFEKMAVNKCNFLFVNYTNIFNRLMRDELDLSILQQFLLKLREIENGTIDQHEASVEIGGLLKKLYIDSALRRDKKTKGFKKEKKKSGKNISWNEFKKSGLNN
jgi:hypothetical protein|uniref:Uncharacterized protein n=1 Tax=viral metagenome TaxID=1070528 RepID=A0A6C0AK22_9ZZZZ